MQNNELEAEGGCLCGAIRYRVAGKAVSTNLCFCKQCQRQTGAPVPAFLTVAAGDLFLVQGQPASYAASARATREFCQLCGTCLFWRGSAESAGTVDVFLGTLDEPERVPRPSFAIWAEHRLAWLPELASVTYAQGRPEGG